ncbi:hypothetical protein HLH26_07275 [Gluconacetobacter sp. 1b LMG 1731]|uniref:Phage tail collar domain-containing protein n=2 Tax=Gluconacetobacter dulcium TaxID=2729096 RepID=A0A7W4IK36_9PROT|nr:hypothetical protein [Gluconacetobacter dulcium]MBB2193585.1 hypothetical protein [Gluconacetobacter dulcium]
MAGPTAPPGWLLCDGRLVSRTTYAALFAVVGTRFGGGDGSTTFALPDLRGRAVFGLDTMGGTAAGRVTRAGAGLDGTQLGARGGNQAAQAHAHPLTDDGHDHPVNDQGHDHRPSNGTGFVVPQKSGGEMGAAFAGGGRVEEKAATRTGKASTALTMDRAKTGVTIAAAGDGDSQNMPPAIVLNRMIYTGIKPHTASTVQPLTAKAVLTVPFTDTIPRTITWETADGSGHAGTDYEDTEGGLMIPPGWQEVAAYIPITPRLPGLPPKTFDVIFKWYDKTAEPLGYGIGQMSGWPLYPVRRQTVQVTIADIPVTLDISDLPATARWTTRDGTALAGRHYLASSGTNSTGTVTVPAAPYSRGQPRRYLYIDVTDDTGLLASRVLEIVPPALPAVSAAPTTVAVTSAVLPACVPKIAIDVPATTDAPDQLPLSTMRALASDWHVENLGSDRNAVMTLTVTSSGCALQIFDDHFAGGYTQPDSGTLQITGTAERITAVKTMFQARPLAAGPATIAMALAAPDGTTVNATYAVQGVGSAMTWVHLPADGQVLPVSRPSAGITPFSGILTVANTDPFVEMTVTIEPDETGGQVMGPDGAAVAATDTGRGLIVTGNASVLAAVMIPLTIYVGDGLTPPPTAGRHTLTLTATDGTTTITAAYPYNVTL